MLRMIEDIAKDEDELQNSFQTLDGCNGKSNHFLIYLLFKSYYILKTLSMSVKLPLVFTNAGETEHLQLQIQFTPSPKATLPS